MYTGLPNEEKQVNVEMSPQSTYPKWVPENLQAALSIAQELFKNTSKNSNLLRMLIIMTRPACFGLPACSIYADSVWRCHASRRERKSVDE